MNQEIQNNQTNKSIKLLSLYLKDQKQAQKLGFNSTKIQLYLQQKNYGQACLKNFQIYLVQFQNLKNLSLEMINCKIQGQHLEQFVSSLHKCPNIKYLNLNFKLSYLQQKSIFSSIHKMQNLKSLKLNLSNCYITDDICQIMLDDILKISNLSKLLIDLDQNRLKSIPQLNQMNENLKNFTIILSQNNIKNSQQKQINQWNFPSLKRLSIQLDNNEISDTHFIFRNTEQILNQLIFFEIDLRQSQFLFNILNQIILII
ncbi:hypothetical protein ABPG74_019136 [Tetrahymena malaccensis]